MHHSLSDSCQPLDKSDEEEADGKVTNKYNTVEKSNSALQCESFQSSSTSFRHLPIAAEKLESVRHFLREGKQLIHKRSSKKTSDTVSPTVSKSGLIAFNCLDERVNFTESTVEEARVRQTVSKLRTSPASNLKRPTNFVGYSQPASFNPLVIKAQRKLRHFFGLTVFLLFLLLTVCTILPILPKLLVGFLWAFFLHFYFTSSSSADHHSAERIGAAKDGKADKFFSHSFETPAYRGWINHLRMGYDPTTYHVRSTDCVLAVLHENILRLLEPKNSVIKHSSCFETISEPSFCKQEVFNLKGAVVSLRPERLAKRRWWSRKYPICIQLDAKFNTNKRFSNTHLRRRRKDSILHEMDSDRPSISRTTSSGNFQGANIGPKKYLYLFARTGREKEQWFFRLAAAAGKSTFDSSICREYSLSDGEMTEESSTSSFKWLFFYSIQKHYEQYAQGMRSSNTPDTRDGRISMNLLDHLGKPTEHAETIAPCTANATWLNAFISRTFFDFATDRKWIDHVEGKIQRKLATIRLPWFLDALKLVALKPGSKSPNVTPYETVTNDWGVWVDFDIDYAGGLSLELETKVNLMKLKRADHKIMAKVKREPTRHSDEELPESPESSDDEEGGFTFGCRKSPERRIAKAGNLQLALKSFVDKVSQTKHFQDATENRFVQKIMHGVSDTPLVLIVEVPQLSGRMAVNFPPPPSDRLWYGFRSRPSASIRAVPKVGQLTVNVAHVTDWIEKKLKNVLEKGLVIPNMDDVVVPFRSMDTFYTRYNM